MGIIEAVILTGGRGSRLRKIVSDRPKTMAEVQGAPFLDMLIGYLKRFGFSDCILCVGYMADSIEKYYSGRKNPVHIRFSREESPLGTGGAVKNAERLIRGDIFLVMNGDSFCPVDLGRFVAFHKKNNALLSMVLAEADDVSDYGQIMLDSTNRIIRFREKGSEKESPLISAGIYLFAKEVLSMIPPHVPHSLEYDLFPKLVGGGFYGFITKERLIDIGTPERYENAKRIFNREKDLGDA